MSMGTICIDGRDIPFEEGDNVLKAALTAGVEIPHFCYHPALGSLGACRLCAVEIAAEDNGTAPRVVMACLEPAREGMQVSVSAAAARGAREGVIELLMTNHPHDCPVCDEGGECHLQEMTVACGPAYRRYRGRKRTFPNQYLGPLVHHEMNRCITCYRCTRFYRDYALGDDFGTMRLRNEVYFGRFQDGALTSPFAGNLVEVCPTGVFTDAVFRQHFTRVWDLQTAPSICPHCSVGCNTLPGARNGTLRRVRNRPHAEINRWFLCDRGRYGHQYGEHAARPLLPRVAGASVGYLEAIAAAMERIKSAGNGLAGLGSAREDMEGNTLLRALMHKLDGAFAAFSDPALESAMASALIQLHNSAQLHNTVPTLIELEQADAALIAGDLTAHAPMMDLALRQAFRHGASLDVLHSSPAPLTRFALTALTVPPREMDACLSRLNELLADPAASTPPEETLSNIAAHLSAAQRPVVIGVVETLGATGVTALTQLATAANARLVYAMPGPNACGVALLAAAGSTRALLEGVESGHIQTLLVAGNDPFGDARLGARWRTACQRLDTLIVLDCIATATALAADILIPVAAWAERGGTFVNYEGRAQGFAPAFQRTEPLPATAEIMMDLALLLALDLPDAASLPGDALPGYQTPTPGAPGTRLIPIRTLAIVSEGHSYLPSPSVRRWPEGSDEGETATHHGIWQAALSTWYGDDPLASFAPALLELTPTPAARIAPQTACNACIEDGARVTLRGPAGVVVLPVQFDSGVAMDTIALSRATLVQLGLGHGDPLDLEPIG